jgi:SPP1 family predicted phage head-tail adaptor
MIRGKYPHKVILERPVNTADGAGGVTVVWQRYGQSRCYIGTLSGSEILQQQALQNPRTYKIGMPYREGVEPTHRLTDEKGTRYNIRAVMDVNGLGKILEILAESGVA